jgi:PKD repeat protein
MSFFLLIAVAAFAQGTAVSVNISVVDSNNNPVPNHIVTLVDSSFMGSWYALTTNASGVINTVVTVPTPALGTSKQLYLNTYDNCNNYYSTDTLLTSSTSSFSWAYTFVVCTQSNPATCNYTVSASLVAGQPNMIYFDYANASPTATNFLWNFGDGTTSTQPTTFHTYAQPGTYYYCLTIDSCPPVCDSVVVLPITGCNPYFASAVNNNTVDIFPYNISGQYQIIVDWGDATVDTFTPANIPVLPNYISHTYASPGSYSICFTHSNASIGCSNTWCDTVVVGSATPLQCNASFIIDTVNSQPGTVYAWNMSAVTGGSAATTVNFIWDFGDGTTSNQPYPTHNYQNPGSYTICLTMTAVDSSLITCISTYCDSLTVDQNGNIIYKGALVGWNFVVLNPSSIGIDEDALASSKIYPNPARDVLNVDLPEGLGTTEVYIFNTSGTLVNKSTFMSGNNTIDVANLPSGMYILQLSSDAATKQVKFIKN